MRKTLKFSLLSILVILFLITSIACTPNTPQETPDVSETPDVTEASEIKVTLDLQNGTEPIVKYVKPGEPVDFPTVEDEPYRKFRGWYESSFGFGSWNESTPITSEITLYGCWDAIPAEVSFNLNYEGAPTMASQTLNLGELVKQPENVPARECWALVGWFTDKELTAPFNWDELLSDESLTLYAGWKLEDGHVHEYTTVTTPSCTTDGYDTNTCLCGDTYIDNEIAMTGHSFDFTDADYFEMIYCDNKGCKEASRRESLRIYDDDFVYDFNAEKKAEIDARYAQILEVLGGIAKYDEALHGYVKDSDRYKANKAFEDIYNAFYDDINYVMEQYQYAYVFYCVDENDANTENYEFVSEYRTALISDFYTLYRTIYETEYREYFYAEDEGWTDEDIKKALVLSDSYGNEEYKEINDRINEIEIEFREISSPASSADVPKLYEEFIKLNNELAKLAGYDNYVEYAYENVYNRDYTPEETAQMRNLLKDNFKTLFRNVYYAYRSAMGSVPAAGTEAHDIYSAITSKSIFKSPIGTELVKSYFELMNSTTAGDKEIDFYLHANDLFKNGNYYTGNYSGAFSYWIEAQDTSILYFGPGSYSGAFTFIHEYGHYYQNVYNKGISISYDLEEIYSQANEIMFLAYLEDQLDPEILKQMYNAVYYDNLFNSLSIIMLATAVDEFEYCVYTNTAPDGTPREYTAADYDELFSAIMSSYGLKGLLNESYWRYVVIEAPCYYISYAMSAIPCLELLSIADTEGFDAAKEIYLNLFTFTDDEANVETDDMGDKIVKIGFADTLEYVGLSSVFEGATYTRIAEYLYQNKDFTYGEAA